MSSETVCGTCNRRIIFDGSTDVRAWVHLVEPTPDHHAAEPICPICGISESVPSPDHDHRANFARRPA